MSIHQQFHCKLILFHEIRVLFMNQWNWFQDGFHKIDSNIFLTIRICILLIIFWIWLLFMKHNLLHFLFPQDSLIRQLVFYWSILYISTSFMSCSWSIDDWSIHNAILSMIQWWSFVEKYKYNPIERCFSTTNWWNFDPIDLYFHKTTSIIIIYKETDCNWCFCFDLYNF